MSIADALVRVFEAMFGGYTLLLWAIGVVLFITVYLIALRATRIDRRAGEKA